MDDRIAKPEPGGSGPVAMLVTRLARGVDHAHVLTHLAEQGMISGRYILLTILSAAIAMLGLLLSSPAVIIGAMLVSPLMGPIILLGLSFWRVDWQSIRRAVTSLATGFAVAFAVAALLTWASPLKEPTAEILSRTRPNLFDLLVAVFSGVAGGYAVVRERGETVIGVAIATALMPPVAAVGFGVGIGDWRIAGGALLLFTTNLIAIAIAAAAVAALFGFHRQSPGRGWLGNVAVFAVLAGLCVPLTLSLRTIVRESRATVLTHKQVKAIFGSNARLSGLTAREEDGRMRIGGLVATPRFVRTGNDDLTRHLADALGQPVEVTIGQVVLAHPERLSITTSNPATRPSPTDPAAQTVQSLRDAVPFATQSIAYDPASETALVMLAARSGLALHTARVLEERLRARDGLAKVRVLPPVASLAPAPLTMIDKAPVFGAELDDALWALTRWRAAAVSAHLCRAPRSTREPVRALLAERLQDTVVTFDTPSRSACRTLGATAPALVLVPG